MGLGGLHMKKTGEICRLNAIFLQFPGSWGSLELVWLF